jgi:indole-3-glycerol phosphate synthase
MIRSILETKKAEVRELAGMDPGERRRPVRPFRCAGPVNIIAELKRKSPSAGYIGEVDDERIALYSRYAAAISVLTDRTYFGGSFDFLEEVAMKSTKPILAKDFIIHESQIDVAYARGADMVLLIARILGKERLEALYRHARLLGLECLVEVHKAEELPDISTVRPRIVGVNARDLDTLSIDLDLAAAILKEVDAPVRVAESGIRSRQDIERFSEAGARVFLIGETLMKSRDLDAAFRELLHG